MTAQMEGAGVDLGALEQGTIEEALTGEAPAAAVEAPAEAPAEAVAEAPAEAAPAATEETPAAS